MCNHLNLDGPSQNHRHHSHLHLDFLRLSLRPSSIMANTIIGFVIIFVVVIISVVASRLSTSSETRRKHLSSFETAARGLQVTISWSFGDWGTCLPMRYTSGHLHQHRGLGREA